jgi:large conductance mechanosensitive channel
MLKGFKAFLTRGNVIDLAVAFVMGAAFTAVVQALVKDLLTPFIAALVGKPNFGNLSFEIHHSTFNYGDFLNSLVSFLLVGSAIYFFIVLPLNKLAERRRRHLGLPPEPEAKPTEVEVLTQIRDLLSQQRPY